MATLELDLNLGLEDKATARQFKKAIMKIIDAAFDLRLNFDAQPRSIFDDFERKLIEQFPLILDNTHWSNGEQKIRMLVVYKYARSRFSNKRSKMKAFRINSSITGGTANEYRTLLKNRSSRKQYEKSKPGSTRHALPPSSTGTTILATPSMGRIKTSDSSTDMPHESSPPCTPASPTTLVESSPQDTTGPLPESLQTRVEEVVHFLRTCIPDMSYFLPAFIEFGCRSQSFLVALGSYPDERIDGILRKIAGNVSSGVGVTEMDIWVLKEGLKKFVLSTKSSTTKKRRVTE